MKKSVIFLLIVVFLLMLSGCSVATMPRQGVGDNKPLTAQETLAAIRSGQIQLEQPERAWINNPFADTAGSFAVGLASMASTLLAPLSVVLSNIGYYVVEPISPFSGTDLKGMRSLVGTGIDWNDIKKATYNPSWVTSGADWLTEASIAIDKYIGKKTSAFTEASKLKFPQPKYSTAEIAVYSLLGGAFVSVLIVVLYMKLAVSADEVEPANNIPNPEADYIDAEIIEDADTDIKI